MNIKKTNDKNWEKVAVLCLVFGMSFSALADNKLKNIVDVAEIDYQKTLLQAESGDPEAQTNLGSRYIDGYEVYQDYDKAFMWFKKAADQGYPEGQYHIALMYSNGESIPSNESEAFKWFKLSADQGFDYASLQVGIRYLQGIGVNKNYKESLRWLKIAADQNIGDAQLYLGVMYFSGEGVPENKAIAKKYFAEGCINHSTKSCSLFIQIGE